MSMLQSLEPVNKWIIWPEAFCKMWVNQFRDGLFWIVRVVPAWLPIPEKREAVQSELEEELQQWKQRTEKEIWWRYAASPEDSGRNRGPRHMGSLQKLEMVRKGSPAWASRRKAALSIPRFSFPKTHVGFPSPLLEDDGSTTLGCWFVVIICHRSNLKLIHLETHIMKNLTNMVIF